VRSFEIPVAVFRNFSQNKKLELFWNGHPLGQPDFFRPVLNQNGKKLPKRSKRRFGPFSVTYFAAESYVKNPAEPASEPTGRIGAKNAFRSQAEKEKIPRWGSAPKAQVPDPLDANSP
jgi:hypothetical protein